MRYAINVPNFGDYADPAAVLDLARAAEEAGWDGLFVWDHLLGATDWRVPMADPWVLLAAAATVTHHIRLGPMVTPLPRRRPWVVARQAVTLDHLSGGRLTLGVGLGHPPEAEFAAFGEDPDPAVRARRLDEGLAILAGLWSGEPFAHAGAAYELKRMTFLPRPVQEPRPPIWVAGYWPHRAPLRRAARWDGVVPLSAALAESDPGAPIPLSELEEVVACVAAERGDRGLSGFDVVVNGTSPSDAAEAVALHEDYERAGATWWSENVNGWRGSPDEMLELVRRGPLRG
jgi:alkanesulfonate monooxygenase SsuD/methylene tetrahydromethanopterin reductase-like flavin-dependent oxidoreductase (luciferase family)